MQGKGSLTHHVETNTKVGVRTSKATRGASCCPIRLPPEPITMNLPPASGSQSVGIQPAHVPHTDQSHDEVLHPLGDEVLAGLSSHCGREESACRKLNGPNSSHARARQKNLQLSPLRSAGVEEKFCHESCVREGGNRKKEKGRRAGVIKAQRVGSLISAYRRKQPTYAFSHYILTHTTSPFSSNVLPDIAFSASRKSSCDQQGRILQIRRRAR